MRTGQRLLRVEPSGDAHVLSTRDPVVATSPAGAVVLEETKRGPQLGLLDPETNGIAANEQLNGAARKFYPRQLTAGSNGLLAWWSRWEPAYGSVVFDMDSLQRLGIAKSPKSIEYVSEVVPTYSGLWIRGTNKKRQPKVMFLPFDGKPLTVDPCSVTAVSGCQMRMHSGPDDAVWFVAGAWDEEVGHFADPMLLRYDGTSAEPTMTATGWAVTDEADS